MNPWHLEVLLVSAVGIAYQVALMRVFSIAQWHHFAYMVISIAMLGFGAGGTALSMAGKRIAGRERPLFQAAAFLVPFSLIGCYAASQRIPFETFQLITQPRQLGYLLALYFVLAIPFFLVSACVTLGFLLDPRQVGRLYALTMAGSGLGALGVAALLYLAHPVTVVFVLALVAGGAHGLTAFGSRRGRVAGLLALLIPACAFPLRSAVPVRVSEYKGLSYALQYPDARIVSETPSPMSVVTAVSSALIRETPGQVSNYPWDRMGPLPAQIGLYFDAGGVSPVSRFDGNTEPFAYLDYVTGAVAYQLVERPAALIIGAGGGAEVLSALYHRAAHVTAIEVDPGVHRSLRGPLRAFSGDLYYRPEVTWTLAEGRGFLESRADCYDLIEIALLDAFNSSAAGVHALNESYLYTQEAFSLYLERLTPTGVLAVTRWLKTPPRDELRLFATAVEACERAGIAAPSKHLVFIRSWNTGTIVVSRSPLTQGQVGAARDFCTTRGFDLCYLPGILPEETNRYTVLERPYYYEFAKAVLSPARESVYRNALFCLRPATDDRPYFFRFFKWASLPRLVQGMGAEWIPFVEWGYIALVATLVQGAVAAAVLILLPLVTLARHPHKAGTRRWVLAYFAALGLAYMFIEIAFIQRFMLFLCYPVYAVAVVLTALLTFSGLGSLFAGRLRQRRPRAVGVAVSAIAALAGLYVVFLPGLFHAWAGWADWARVAASVALLAPLAFCMGIPFPTGLQTVADEHAPLLPWAWGINGCASVAGASLATLIAVHLGFRMLVGFAVVVYAVAAVALVRLERTGAGP